MGQLRGRRGAIPAGRSFPRCAWISPLLGLLLAACAQTQPLGPPSAASPPSQTSSEAVAGCPTSSPIATPEWLGAIPLPSGSFVVDTPPDDAQGYRLATVIVPMSAKAFLQYAVEQWAAAGIQLGRGESERTESEATFGLGTAIGGFKANDLSCPLGSATVALRYRP